jgi:hypothetical protein
MNMVFLSNCARIQAWEAELKRCSISASTVRPLPSTFINGTLKVVCTFVSLYVLFTRCHAGHLAALLEPKPEFIPLVGAFFSTSHYPRLEWIHDFAKPVSKFKSAVNTLEAACQAETRLDVKQVSSSLGN